MLFDDSVPTLLNTEQVAHLLGIKPHTLAVARCDGSNNIPYFKIGRSVRYRKAEVEAYLVQQQRGDSLIEKQQVNQT
jgi:predicted DNA-binding transcriptional regulator AlpA